MSCKDTVILSKTKPSEIIFNVENKEISSVAFSIIPRYGNNEITIDSDKISVSNDEITIYFSQEIINEIGDSASYKIVINNEEEIFGAIYAFEDDVIKSQKIELKIKGNKALSSYEIAVKNGFIGTEKDWVSSHLKTTDLKLVTEKEAQTDFKNS